MRMLFLIAAVFVPIHAAAATNYYIRSASGTALGTGATVTMNFVAQSSAPYKMQFNLSSTYDATWKMICNGDSGNTYQWAIGTVNAAAGAVNTGGATSANYMQLTVANEPTKAGTPVIGDLFLMHDLNNLKKVTVQGLLTRRGNGGATLLYTEHFSGIYAGTVDVTSCAVTTTAGNISGWWSMQALVD